MTTKAAGEKPLLECFSPQFNHWTSIKPRKRLEKGGREVFFLSLVITKKVLVGTINEWSQEKGVTGNATKLGKMSSLSLRFF